MTLSYIITSETDSMWCVSSPAVQVSSSHEHTWWLMENALNANSQWQLRCIVLWVWPPSHWRCNSCHTVGSEPLHTARLLAALCILLPVRGCHQVCCESHAALHHCWGSSEGFNLTWLDCQQSLCEACVVALGDRGHDIPCSDTPCRNYASWHIGKRGRMQGTFPQLHPIF